MRRILPADFTTTADGGQTILKNFNEAAAVADHLMVSPWRLVYLQKKVERGVRCLIQKLQKKNVALASERRYQCGKKRLVRVVRVLSNLARA